MDRKERKTNGVILVIDDDHAFSRRIHNLLNALNLEVHRARNAQEALDRLEEIDPDVILLDMLLPDVSGLSLLRRLRATEAVQDRPVLITSGLVMSGDRSLALSAGASGFLPKPYSLTDLQEALPKPMGARLLAT